MAPRSGRLIVVAFVGLALVAIFTVVLYAVTFWGDMRREAWGELSGAARFMATTTELRLNGDRSALRLLGRDIGRLPGLSAGQDSAAIDRLGRRFSRRHPEIAGLALLGPHGSLWWREGLAPHNVRPWVRASTAAQPGIFEVGSVDQSNARVPVLPLWSTMRAGGRVRFRICALLSLSRRQGLWPGRRMAPGTAIGLFGVDGRVEAVWPASLSAPAIKAAAAVGLAGEGRFVAHLKGREGTWLGVARRVRRYPFRVFALRSMRAVDAQWWHITRLGLLLLGLVLAIIIFLYRRTVHGQTRAAEERALTEAQLSAAKAHFEGTLQSLAEAVVATDQDGRVEYVNRAAERLTGWAEGEIRGRALNDVLPCFDEYSGESIDPLGVCLAGQALAPGDAFVFHRDGRGIPVEYSGAPRFGPQGELVGAVLSFRDAAEKRKLAERLVHQATHDPLTELPNRILYNERLERALVEAKESGSVVALLFLDVDGFKRVNDTLGHSTGDRILVLIGERLRRAVRAADTLARLGGDEFAVVLPGLRSRQDALPVVHKIMAIFREPLVVALGEVSLSVSIGIAAYPEDSGDGRALVRAADAAMYEAKAAGKDAYRFFEGPTAGRPQAHPFSVATTLRRALEREEFCLVYQPQVRAMNRRLVAMEALLRWMHPVEGVKYPGEFLLAVEEAGLMTELGVWVLRAACRQNREWRNLGLATFPVTVNVSGHQCGDEGLACAIRAVLREHDLTPNDLVLEFTESVLVAAAEASTGGLHALLDEGIQFAVQNFGGASSSLGMLKQLRVGMLKIESAFIAGIGESSNDAVILAIIALGHALNMRVVASGVETAAQHRFLADAGCDAMQGHYIAAPLDAEAATAYLRTQEAAGS
ncbi:MAG: putative bifunctional diguanylate cyclase/phosphodiesterase [Acidiferrobacter sp.]